MSEFDQGIPGPPGRPDHPDFWKLCDVVLKHDASTEDDTPESLDAVIAEFVDPEVLAYMAFQRTLRMCMSSGADLPIMQLLPMLGGSWVDGFVAGAAFQQAKTA